MTPFALTLGHLLADRGRVITVSMGLAASVFSLWVWWAARIPLNLYEVSLTARIELDASTSPIQSPVRGRVMSTHLRVGRPVRRGEVVVEIDSAPDRLRLRQEQVRADGIEPELVQLRSQIAAEEQARVEERQGAHFAIEEALSQIREAETAARYAEGELARVRELHRTGLVPDRDLARTKTEAETLRSAVETFEAAARRLPQDQRTRDSERNVRIERLRSDIARLESERRAIEAGRARFEYEIERHRVRSSVDGVVAESAILRDGAVVVEGEKLASIAAAGGIFVTAQFPADRALGRVRAGQPALLRLDAFPWAQFGSVDLTVTSVAREIRDGSVRVELAVAPESAFRGPLQHGMTGSVEVVVEQITPLWLLLRSAGLVATSRP